MSTKKRRPLRKLVFLAVLVGIAIAIKNALEDKGGSYEAPVDSNRVPTPPAPAPTSPVPAPEAPAAAVVTAEEIVEHRPVENLDEFADPLPAEPIAVEETVIEPVAIDKPADHPVPVNDDNQSLEDVVPTPAAPEEPKAHRPRKRSAAAEALAKAEEAEEVPPGKIDPFGIR